MEKDMPLEGRIAVVTGASRGIGAGIAERLGSAGATVVVAARTLSAAPGVGSAEDTVQRIVGRGGKALAMPVDMEDPVSRAALIANTVAGFGRIDILVSNAGTANYIATDEMPLEVARSQNEIYFLGPWHLFHLVLPHMKRAGKGWILQVGSCAVADPQPPYAEYNAGRGHETLYGAVKAAVHRLATGLASEVFEHNIAVNVVAPVLAVYTPGLASLNMGLTPDHPIVEPVEDISEAAVAMLSHEPQAYTGQVEYSHQYLDRIGRPTRSLDGKSVIKARAPKAPAHVG